ncbi:DUF3800 domain-containing protein [Clostridium saudiense]|uniref:DUF3800 domain-containing protein n=1 Tax=Clostridium saudiense TaxID=1414720 RepID=UPI0032652AAB
MINIYCDESCHLEVSNKNKKSQKSMVLGGIVCPDNYKKQILNDIRDIKEKHGLSRFGEFKWTKVSQNKIGFYEEIIKYFFCNKNLKFRSLVFKDKADFDYTYYTHDNIYYIAYYLLLIDMVSIDDMNSIYIDKKDTRGGKKVKELEKNLLDNKFSKQVKWNGDIEFKEELIKKIQIIDSRDVELMQLADLLIGAVAYINRIEVGEELKSESKLHLIDLIKEYSGYSLTKTTLRQEEKFNIFVWSPWKRR